MTFDRTKIKDILSPIVEDTINAIGNDSDLRRNTIDIFSKSIECTILNITNEEWENRELDRQTQKTFQNKIGELHQKILGTIDNITDLGTGKIIDLEGPDFIAEIKNKHNTTKGNHKIAIYDDLEQCLRKEENQGKIGYYVEILPKNGHSYDKPFTPSDNKQKQKRPENNNIRQIDGKSFYKKVTGNQNALEEIYKMLPELVAEIIREKFDQKRDINNVINQEEFDYIYK